VKKVLIFVAILMICASSMVNAQDLTGMFNISPYAGLGIPMGKMSDTEGEDALARTTGFKFGANAEYFFTPNIGAGVDFMYAIFGNDYTDAEIEELGDNKLHTINIGGHVKYVFMPESMLRPYATAGVGVTMNKVKDYIIDFDNEGNPILGDAKLGTKMFLNGGIGAMYWVSEMISIFGEADFDYLLTKNATIEIDGEDTGEEITSSYYFLDFKVGLSVWFGGSE
jgi:opacity protein-like surface antigen